VVALTVNLIGLPKNRWAEMKKWGVFVAGVPSSLAPRNPFFSGVLAPLPLSRLCLLRRLKKIEHRKNFEHFDETERK